MTNAKDNLVGTEGCDAAEKEVTAWQQPRSLDARKMCAVSCEPGSQGRLCHALLVP